MIFSIFFFKQKTAYEMRISDWSSDVCSSDLKWAYPPAQSQPSSSRARSPDAHRRNGTAELLCSGETTTIPSSPGDTGAQLDGSSTSSMKRSLDRKSVVKGKSVSVRVDLGGRRII